MLHTPRLFQAAALGLIVSCGALVAPQASAEHQSNQRQVTIERNTRGGSVRVQVNTGRDDYRPAQRYEHVEHNDRYRQGDRYDRGDRRDYGHRDHRPVHQPTCPPPPSGYWKTVYHPPVYRTTYDCYGRPQCVMVRRGYYERVWVANDRHRGHVH